MTPTQPERTDGPAIHTEGRGRWLGLAMLSLGVAMIIVDATIVNVAVPSIIADLDLDSTPPSGSTPSTRSSSRRSSSPSGGWATCSAGGAMYLAGLVVFARRLGDRRARRRRASC